MTDEQREKKKEYDRRYREKHRDSLLVRKREWWHDHKQERSEEYRKKQRDAARFRYNTKDRFNRWKRPGASKDDFSFGNDRWKALMLEDKLWREKHGVK